MLQKADKGIEKIEMEEKQLALAMKFIDFITKQRHKKGKLK